MKKSICMVCLLAFITMTGCFPVKDMEMNLTSDEYETSVQERQVVTATKTISEPKTKILDCGSFSGNLSSGLMGGTNKWIH